MKALSLLLPKMVFIIHCLEEINKTLNGLTRVGVAEGVEVEPLPYRGAGDMKGQ